MAQASLQPWPAFELTTFKFRGALLYLFLKIDHPCGAYVSSSRLHLEGYLKVIVVRPFALVFETGKMHAGRRNNAPDNPPYRN